MTYKQAIGGVVANPGPAQIFIAENSPGWDEYLKWLNVGNVAAPMISPLSIESLAEQKRREVDTARDAKINEGFNYTFNNSDDVVQTRQRDRENLTGLAVSAQRHADYTFHFRAESNTTYELSAEDVLALADAAQNHVSDQYAKSWQLKAKIETALKDEDRSALENITWDNAE